MKKETITKAAKILALTVLTFGLYGAYWAMTQSAEEPDISDDEEKKDADTLSRAATSALLMRHDLH